MHGCRFRKKIVFQMKDYRYHGWDSDQLIRLDCASSRPPAAPRGIRACMFTKLPINARRSTQSVHFFSSFSLSGPLDPVHGALHRAGSRQVQEYLAHGTGQLPPRERQYSCGPRPAEMRRRLAAQSSSLIPSSQHYRCREITSQQKSLIKVKHARSVFAGPTTKLGACCATAGSLPSLKR